MADCCILFSITIKKQNPAKDGGGSTQYPVLHSAKRAIKPVQGRTGLILPLFPLVSFCRCCFLPAVFFLSTDTDVGGSKQKRVLLSKTCYQTCTRMYRFDNRFQKPQMLFDRPRTEIFKNVLPCTFLNYEFFSGKTCFCLTPLTSCQYEFDIPSNSLSSAVQGCTMLDRGYRFNRCP